MNIEKLVRKNILELTPYSSAREEFTGHASVFLDANENPFPSPYNRYPDPYQKKLKQVLGALKGVDPTKIFLGNGSDEPIDLLIRAFCEPHKDAILITPPTYGMYKVCADINAVKVHLAPLTKDFQLDIDKINSAINSNTKLIFLCSPNNPSGNLLQEEQIKKIIGSFRGIVVLDEAYIDFSTFEGFSKNMDQYPNLVILQTLSKAWGLAGLRLGMCFASPSIISILNKIKYPYNLNVSTQELVLKKLSDPISVKKEIAALLKEREILINELSPIPYVEKVYPSDANFLLVKMTDAKKVYNLLADKGIVVRDRSNVTLCENCLRITVGTPEENKIVLEKMKSITL